MATAPTDIEFSGFTKFLILNGLLTESEAKIHSQEAQKKKIPLLSYLVANNLVGSQIVATKASIEYGIPYFDLNAIDLRSLPINLINEKLIRKHQALPLFTGAKRYLSPCLIRPTFKHWMKSSFKADFIQKPYWLKKTN